MTPPPPPAPMVVRLGPCDCSHAGQNDPRLHARLCAWRRWLSLTGHFDLQVEACRKERRMPMTPPVGHADRLRQEAQRMRDMRDSSPRGLYARFTADEQAYEAGAAALDREAAREAEVATLWAERDRLRAALERLVDQWVRDAAAFPVGVDPRAEPAAAAVRLCAQELRAALTASPEERRPER